MWLQLERRAREAAQVLQLMERPRGAAQLTGTGDWSSDARARGGRTYWRDGLSYGSSFHSRYDFLPVPSGRAIARGRKSLSRLC